MNPFYFTTLEEANRVLALIGSLGWGGKITVPSMVGPVQGQTVDGDKKMYQVHLNNNYETNAGMVLQNILKYGAMSALMYERAAMVDAKCPVA